MILSDDVLQGLLEAAPDAIVAVAPGGTIVFANQRTEDLLGWPGSDLVGSNVEVLVPERFQARHPELRAGYREAPTARPMGASTELWARRRDGTEVPVEISLSAIDTPDGQLVAAAIRDVTRARLAEQKFRGLLASAPDAILGVGPDGRIELVNEQAERLFGWAEGELVGQPIEALVPEGAVGRHRAHRASYLAHPVSRPMGLGLQLRARRCDGSEFPAEISLSTIASDDGGATVLAAVRDVTDRLEFERARQRRALEAQREQSHRLESIGQLAGGVAHDFNNLLGVIVNYATLAERGTDDEAVRADIGQIREAAERAAELTRQLLSFARRDVARPERVDLADLVRQFGAMLTRTLGDHVELVVDADAVAEVDADRHQLEQVLLNLCLNARDAMPEGGTLALVVRAEGTQVVLSVVDHGTGMDPDTLDRAFDPFFTTKPAGEGTGLGLASVYGLVQQNHGTVRMSSEPGVGTTVDVRLPAGVGDRDQPERAPGGRPPTRVLVVEDEEWLRTVIVRMLRDGGYEVRGAADGREALKLLHDEGEVDVVLTDVVMPGVSGPDLARELARIRPTTRVVFMSGYAPSGLDVPGAELLAKPFTEEQLFQAVRGALDG